MKKLACLVVVMVCVFLFGSVSFAGGGRVINEVRPKVATKSNQDLIYEINLPSDIDNPNVVARFDQSSWFCDDDQRIEFISWSAEYNYVKYLPDLTKFSFNKVSLSGKLNSDWYTRDLKEYVSSLPESKVIFIRIASYECAQSWTQEYDSDLDKWTCSVETGYTCSDVYYYETAGSEVVLTIEPYLRVSR